LRRVVVAALRENAAFLRLAEIGGADETSLRSMTIPNASRGAKLKERQKIVLGLMGFKMAYLSILLGALGLRPDFEQATARAIQAGWFATVDAEFWPDNQAGLARHFATWDAAHYLVLSDQGYSNGLRSCAFYPLWPLLVRWFSALTGGSHIISGVILANLFSLAGWILFYHVARKRFGEPVARGALALLIAFPGSLFYQFIYTESLFFLLLMLLWYGLEQRRYAAAGIAALLLPLTRAVGVFSVLPIAWVWLVRNVAAPRASAALSSDSSLRHSHEMPLQRGSAALSSDSSLRRSDETPLQPLRRMGEWSLLIAPPVGLLVYFALMWSWTGNPFEGMEAQKYWKAHSISNLWNVPKFVLGFFEPTSWHAFQGSALDRCAFLLLLYCLPLLWRMGKDLLIWTYVLGILPAMSGTFVSFTRFESTAFPVFIALAVFFTNRKSRWPLAGFIIALAALHLILLWRFVNYRWTG